MPKCSGCGIEKSYSDAFNWESHDFCSNGCVIQAAEQAVRDYQEAMEVFNKT